jgi:hypothetical protein
MKKWLGNIPPLVIYFLTPEDSGQLVGHGTLLFGIEAGTLTLGSVKAVFWLMMSLGLPIFFARI